MKRGRDLATALAVLVLIGCYRYTPIEAPERGMEVRAQLNAEAAVRRSQGLDEPILRYEGKVVDATPETFSLDVLVARSITPFQDIELRDTVRIERAEVQSIMQRSISPTRSVLLGVGIVAGAAALVAGIDAVVGGTGDDDGGNGPPPAIVVPIFGWSGSRLLPSFLPFGGK